MAARPGVLAGVLVGRAVTAQLHAAFLAGAQVHPRPADLDAFRALVTGAVTYVRHGREMRAPAGAGQGRYSARTWCTAAIAIEPSPTADAARFTLPDRTSPTAKTPGRLVSSR